jgi:hypothetical protein
MDGASSVRRRIPEVSGIDRARFEAEIVPAGRPVVLRDFAGNWPVVQAARRSDAALIDYIRGLDAGRKVRLSVAPPGDDGRFYFDAHRDRFNFSNDAETVTQVLTWLAAHGDLPDGPTVYVQALSAAEALPGFERDNVMDWVASPHGARLWIGNRVRTQTHFDPSFNLAVVCAGRRRFTLFAPEQTPNLYPGPFDLSPGGVPLSLPQIEAPDFALYPRFAEALEAAHSAELEPGDALFIPYAWWHHVQSLSGLNMLANYWWSALDDRPTPFAALYAGMLGIRDLPPEQRRIWKGLMDTYVFDEPDTAYVPPHALGAFGKITPPVLARLRNLLKVALKL